MMHPGRERNSIYMSQETLEAMKELEKTGELKGNDIQFTVTSELENERTTLSTPITVPV